MSISAHQHSGYVSISVRACARMIHESCLYHCTLMLSSKMCGKECERGSPGTGLYLNMRVSPPRREGVSSSGGGGVAPE